MTEWEQPELPFDDAQDAPAHDHPHTHGDIPVTAFLVVVGSNGAAIAYSDLKLPPAIQHVATIADMRRAVLEVAADIAAAQAADSVMERLDHRAQSQQAVQAERIRMNLESREG